MLAATGTGGLPASTRSKCRRARRSFSFEEERTGQLQAHADQDWALPIRMVRSAAMASSRSAFRSFSAVAAGKRRDFSMAARPRQEEDVSACSNGPRPSGRRTVQRLIVYLPLFTNIARACFRRRGMAGQPTRELLRRRLPPLSQIGRTGMKENYDKRMAIGV